MRELNDIMTIKEKATPTTSTGSMMKISIFRNLMDHFAQPVLNIAKLKKSQLQRTLAKKTDRGQKISMELA